MSGRAEQSGTVVSSAREGAAQPTPGLNPLDQEREASMADEGGASGATMERQAAPRPETLARPRRSNAFRAFLIGAAVGAAIGTVRHFRRG